VTVAEKAGQLQLNAMEPVIAQTTLEPVNLLTSVRATLRERCIDGITANRDDSHDHVMRSIGLVAFLNPIIGRHNGDVVGRECARSGRTVRDVVLDMGLLSGPELNEIPAPTVW